MLLLDGTNIFYINPNMQFITKMFYMYDEYFKLLYSPKTDKSTKIYINLVLSLKFGTYKIFSKEAKTQIL